MCEHIAFASHYNDLSTHNYFLLLTYRLISNPHYMQIENVYMLLVVYMILGVRTTPNLYIDAIETYMYYGLWKS